MVLSHRPAVYNQYGLCCRIDFLRLIHIFDGGERYDTFCIIYYYKGAGTFTQLVKVRRGKLVLMKLLQDQLHRTVQRAIWRLMTECCEINLCP